MECDAFPPRVVASDTLALTFNSLIIQQMMLCLPEAEVQLMTSQQGQ